LGDAMELDFIRRRSNLEWGKLSDPQGGELNFALVVLSTLVLRLRSRGWFDEVK